MSFENQIHYVAKDCSGRSHSAAVIGNTKPESDYRKIPRLHPIGILLKLGSGTILQISSVKQRPAIFINENTKLYDLTKCPDPSKVDLELHSPRFSLNKHGQIIIIISLEKKVSQTRFAPPVILKKPVRTSRHNTDEPNAERWLSKNHSMESTIAQSNDTAESHTISRVGESIIGQGRRRKKKKKKNRNGHRSMGYGRKCFFF
jgi:hypothetical protein